MQAFNEALSTARVSVEWLFGDVLNSFKLGFSAVGKYYIVAALFQNTLTCLYGNNTSIFFEHSPPTVHNYLA